MYSYVSGTPKKGSLHVHDMQLSVKNIDMFYCFIIVFSIFIIMASVDFDLVPF